MGHTLGILHPGEMGSSVAAAARASGTDVCWVSEGRSVATRRRAAKEALRELGGLDELVQDADVILSVCPPGEAVVVAQSVFSRGFTGLYVDANAVSPRSARAIADRAGRAGARFVDGGIVGPPARKAGTTVLYLSGEHAAEVEALFAGSVLEVVRIPGGVAAASALKIAYASFTKGSAALLLAVRALARAEGVEGPLLGHWARTHPDLAALSETTSRDVGPKAWRFSGEMDEIAATFGDAGLPEGFHNAAAELYRRLQGLKDAPGTTLEDVLRALLRSP